MADTWSDVKQLKIQLPSGETAGSFYGNGRHQIAVTVSFVPVDGQGKTVSVPPEDILPRVSLVDFVSGAALSTAAQTANWFYSTTPNQYRVAQAETQAIADVLASEAVQLTFYVMCGADSSLRTLSVAARVAPRDSSVVRSTALRGRFQGQVTLTAYEALHYKLWTNTDWEQVPIFDFPKPITLQYNYYLSIKAADHGLDHHIAATDITGYRTAHDRRNRYRSFYCVERVHTAHYAYVWGVTTDETALVCPNATINIHPRANTITFSLTGHDADSLDERYARDLSIMISDQYGNSGRFHVVPDRGNPLFVPMMPLDGKP